MTNYGNKINKKHKKAKEEVQFVDKIVLSNFRTIINHILELLFSVIKIQRDIYFYEWN